MTVPPPYVDDAKEEFGEARDFAHSLAMGQYAEREEVLWSVVRFLDELGEDGS